MLWPYFLALLVISIATAVVMRPALGECTTTILGAPGDATNGGVWTAFNYVQTSGLPWLEESQFTAAPNGEPWWRAYYITALFVFSPIWLFANLTGSPVCGWNLALASGFVLSGLSMFELARRLCRHDVAATIAALAYTVAPYRQLKAEGHIAYVHTYAFPLLLLTGLLLWERPTKPRILAAAAVVALLGYTDGYFILLGAVAFVSLHIGALAWNALIARETACHIRQRATAVVVTAVTASVLLIPVLVTFLTTSSEISTTLSRSKQEVVSYSARPIEYLLPARSHPVLGGVLGEWQDRNLHGSNFSESTLHLGWGVVLAAAAAIISLKRRGDDAEEAWRQQGTAALAVTATVGFLFSLPPRLEVGPLSVSMPSGVVSDIVTFWRVYARFFIVVHAAAVALAAVGLAHLFRRAKLRSPARVGAAAGFVLLVLFESIVSWPQGSWSYGLAPQAYRFVAAQEDVDTIAEWPLLPTSLDPDHRYLTYVPVHRKKLVNVLEDQSMADRIARGIYGLDDPETAGVLRQLGVDLVLVHRNVVPGVVPTDDYELVRSFSYAGDVAVNRALAQSSRRWAYLSPMYDVDVYRIRSGPGSTAAIAVGHGFYGPEGDPATTSSRWMEQDGELMVFPLEKGIREATISFAASSVNERPRRLDIRQGAREVWSGTVTGAQTIKLTVSVGRPLVLTTTPGPQQPPGETRRLSIVVSSLDVASTR